MSECMWCADHEATSRFANVRAPEPGTNCTASGCWQSQAPGKQVQSTGDTGQGKQHVVLSRGQSVLRDYLIGAMPCVLVLCVLVLCTNAQAAKNCHAYF